MAGLERISWPLHGEPMGKTHFLNVLDAAGISKTQKDRGEKPAEERSHHQIERAQRELKSLQDQLELETQRDPTAPPTLRTLGVGNGRLLQFFAGQDAAT